SRSIFILTTNVGQRMIAEMASEGKSLEEITGRMKEALSQIRHTKSDRPVFTPEFLARVKKIIVFLPLTRAAMQGIASKHIAQMQEEWRTRRGKELLVPAELVDYLAEQAHQINERSKGKEGGRIVGKLVSEWIEAAVQHAMTLHPQEYKQSAVVALTF